MSLVDSFPYFPHVAHGTGLVFQRWVPLPPRVAGVQVVQGVWGVMAAVPPLTRWALKWNGPWFSYHVFLRWACGAAGRGNGMDRSEKV